MHTAITDISLSQRCYLACASTTWAFGHPKPRAHGFRKELGRSRCVFPWGCLPSTCSTCLAPMQMVYEHPFWEALSTFTSH